MTVVKQVSVSSPGHMRSLAGYLDRASDRHDVLDFDSQNLNDPGRWADEFARTRAAYGHDRAARRGCKNTVCYHHILGFNPDECDVNGGRLAPADCMGYAREWCGRWYPNQECAWALHLEKAPDGTERYAVHIAINRTDLSNGRRLDEGRASRQRALHAKRVRAMDGEWGLRQLEQGVRNSASHARQRSRGERGALEAGRARDPGFETDLDRVRRSIREGVREAAAAGSTNGMRELARSLEARGIGMHMSGDRARPRRELVFTYQAPAPGGGTRVRRVSGPRLGRGYSLEEIAGRLALAAACEMARAVEESMEDDNNEI